MATCGGCGRNLADSAVRCMYCGATKAPPKECPKCKRKLDPQAIKCIFCNIDLGRPAPSGPDPRAIALARGELFQQAERLRKAGQPLAALGVLDQIVLADRAFAPAFLARGKCLAVLGDPLGATEAARAALAVDPGHAEARALHETWAKAAASLGPRGVAAAAGEVGRAAAEASRLLEAGRHAEALALFDRLVAGIPPEGRDAPELGALHTSRGIALSSLGRLPEALASFAEAIRVAPRYALAWQNQASALDDAGRVKEAALSAERAVELDDRRTNAWVDLGYYRKKLGQTRQALDAYEQALALDPRHPTGNLNLGNLLLEARDLDGAERAYRTALAAAPDFAPARAALERLEAARARGAPAVSHPPGLPPGRPYKTALERATSGEPADEFFSHATIELRRGEIPSANRILAAGWLCAVPRRPGAELLADLLVEGPSAYACRTAKGSFASTVETLGPGDLLAARELLAEGVLRSVIWVVDATPTPGLVRTIEQVVAEVGRPDAMRLVVLSPA